MPILDKSRPVIRRTVHDCSACGKDHINLPFTRLVKQIKLKGSNYSEAAKCPNTRKWVYARETPKPKAPASLTMLVVPVVATRSDVVAAFRMIGFLPDYSEKLGSQLIDALAKLSGNPPPPLPPKSANKPNKKRK